ncbi:MAG: PQQ-like beta-propeller repeat protein [Solirubrobacterales bacterium]|nr:PQQ-like beta-propeller repeat protein [Solirubrobacterales bacterium]
MRSLLARRWLRWGLAGASVALVGAGVAVAVALHAPGNVSHPDVQFTRPPSTSPPPQRRPQSTQGQLVTWPWYGYNAARTRFFDAPWWLKPPLHVGWRYQDGALLEFPPVIDGLSMYLLDDNGWARAIDLRTGAVRWARHVGSLAAASPAVSQRAGAVLMPVLSTYGSKPGGGRFVALDMRRGRVLWSRPVGAGSESSPIVSGETVYYGDQAGNLFARNVDNGHLYWTYHASGAIKGGPALVDGVLFFGDYSGRVYAVRAVNGMQLWSVGTNGAHFGFGSGQFYSTPAVAYGRVYLGNTDGRVYSFGARTGSLAWATSTGAYVYGSAAIADPSGLGPTVYIGSYDGNLYAFNAQSGAIRWRHAAGGRISGSATVVDGVVYFSDLGSKTTSGLNAVTGRPVFSFPDGAFNPVVTDGRTIFLVGYNSVYQLRSGATLRAIARAGRQHQAASTQRGRPAAPEDRARQPTPSATTRTSQRRTQQR